MTEKIIIDTDPGVDDAMAVLFAALHPEVELMGLTSIFGNVTIDVATRNALVLTEMTGDPVPVARGADRPVVQEPMDVAWEVHGHEGFGDIPPIVPAGKPTGETAAQYLCKMVNEHPGEITLCPVGPLTNLALALEMDPAIATKVKQVVVMGGSLDEGGNVTPHAEANIWQDPHAADRVFAAGWPVKLVGLDVTHQVVCKPGDFLKLADAAPKFGGFLNEAAQYYFDFHRRENGFDGCHMHDPTAVISIIQPELFSIDQNRLEVIVEGEKLGQTFRSDDQNRPLVDVCMGIEIDAVRNLFLQTIAGSH